MARPRSLDDERLLNAAADELAQVGPEAFTLAGAAGRAGASAPTYIKRFGSKNGVLLALSHRWADSLPARIDHAAAGLHGVDRLFATLMVGVHELDAAGPGRATNLLAVFARDLIDPKLRVVLKRGWQVQHQRIVGLLADADVAKCIPSAPEPERAARILMALLEGTRIAWCIEPDGSLNERIRGDIATLLDAWGCGDQRPAPPAS